MRKKSSGWSSACAPIPAPLPATSRTCAPGWKARWAAAPTAPVDRSIENALLRAARTGKFGFEDLQRVALGVMDEIARAALRNATGTLGGGQGLGGLLSGLVSSLFGAPGRATGGPVSPGRPYLVGERGPELFVPTSAGSVAAPTGAGGREMRVAITVNASADTAPRALAQSSRQVARAVKAALMAAE